MEKGGGVNKVMSEVTMSHSLLECIGRGNMPFCVDITTLIPLCPLCHQRQY